MQKVLSVFLILLFSLIMIVSCSKNNNSSGDLIYSCNFDSGTIPQEFQKEGGEWFVKNGTLHSTTAKNKDLVLTKPLPENAIIEVDMLSHSKSVDIKFRAWGDRRTDLHDGAYHFILGGWGNKISTIAPLGEHDKRRVTRKSELKPEKWYKIKVIRNNGIIDMYVDGEKYLTYKDTEPLDKNYYKYFSFANWATNCEFDNLKIYKL